ncbi:PilZ domain-containing protein [Aliiruegeria sabulilitoris]|uniref:PilZ domain-containing protein n=1 Tax=Aliiruegeria sabulilitoris TaxID=1510458 RepID=UPI00082C7731|nr:PilZ domain-containing protein [Aliiruegeria sabulilitoris]
MPMNISIPRKPRLETNATVVLRSGDGDSFGAIANLHDEGAMVNLERGLDEGEIVSFVVAGTEVYARIVWKKDNQIGLSFFNPIPIEAVAQLFRETEAKITI